MSERIYYAVGDVHGEHKRLVALHYAIGAHWARLGERRPATVVHLGDYVDRGPDSYAVIAHLMELQRNADLHPDFEIVCLLGNHERLMIDALDTAEPSRVINWLMNGGEATVESYKRAAPAGVDVPEFARSHVDWLKTLPTQLLDREAGLVFVHAGVRPDKFPDCGEEIRLWTRSPKFMKDSKWPKNEKLDGLRVVHGHTPTEGEPYIGPRRINLDTGAVYGGPLTAAVFKTGAPPEFLTIPYEAPPGVDKAPKPPEEPKPPEDLMTPQEPKAAE
jgi:serine/threonine protein phosphatase 1